MSPLRIQKLALPTLLTYLLIGLASALLVSYVIFQARLMIAGPQVELTTELDTIQSDRQIVLNGKAKNITDITLNGRPIVTDEAGNFEEQLVLENGYTIVSIKAHDRYGRETTLTREFVYTPLSLLLN